MVKIYAIVHEKCIKEYLSIRNNQSNQVEKELERIKHQEAFICVDGFPNEIPLEMILPDKRLKVFVCGAFYEPNNPNQFCVNKQLNALRNAGYDAEIYLPASLKTDYDKEKQIRLKRQTSLAAFLGLRGEYI